MRIWKYGRGLHDYVQICINIFKILKILGFVIRLPGLLYQYQAILQKVWNEIQKKILPGFCNIQKVLVEN